jgi:hypothetical protein
MAINVRCISLIRIFVDVTWQWRGLFHFFFSFFDSSRQIKSSIANNVPGNICI